MKRFSWKTGTQLAAVALLGLALFHPPLKADEYNRQTVITISQPLEVPGVVLVPGTYVMRLFNSSSDRHIVQFMTEDRKQQLALTFAVSAERIRPTGKTVLTMYEGSRDAPPALRTWFYPGDVVGQEFLYPHEQAIRISARTKTTVPEVETAQAESAEVVTPAAESAQKTESREESVLIAKAEPSPAPEPAPAPIAAPEPQQPAAEPQSPPATSAQEAPIAKSESQPDSLPHTASNGPLAALIGGFSLLLALGLRKVRRGSL
jgi:hypothetical protein